jgi:hypothetical protein
MSAKKKKDELKTEEPKTKEETTPEEEEPTPEEEPTAEPTEKEATSSNPDTKPDILTWGLGILGIIALIALLIGLIALLGDDDDGKTDKALSSLNKKAMTAEAKAEAANKALSSLNKKASTDLKKVDKKAMAAEAKAIAAKKTAKKALSEAAVASETATAAESKAEKTIDALCRKHPCDALCKEKRPKEYKRCLAWRRRAKKRRSRRWHRQKSSSTPANSALAERVSTLETRVDKHEVLLKPLARLKNKYGAAYDKRVNAALDRVPDKVQGESK